MKVLSKSKIVFEKAGDGWAVTNYMWKKTWWIFGYWYPHGNTSSLNKVSVEKIAHFITNDTVAKALYDTVMQEYKKQ